MAEIIDGISHLDTEELNERLQESSNNKLYIIDVREPEEYMERHIPSVPLLPMGEFPDLVDQFDPEAEYIFVCRSGRRSLEVAKFFRNEGITKVHNFDGGMLAWNKEVKSGAEHIVTDFSMENLERRG